MLPTVFTAQITLQCPQDTFTWIILIIITTITVGNIFLNCYIECHMLSILYALFHLTLTNCQ